MTTNTPQNRLVAVLRVSRRRGREGERFMSPAQQRDAITAWCEAHGVQVVAWFDETDSVSGKTTDRPGLNAAMDMIDRDRADGLIVAKIDRFSRSVSGGLSALARLSDPKRPKRFVAAAEGIDSAGKMSARETLMFNIFLSIAQWQLDTIREGWEDVHERHIARGVGHSLPPYGYARGEDGCLVIVPEQAVAVRQMYQWRIAGMPFYAIAERLNQEHPRPDGQWTDLRIRSMFKNRTYLGEVRYGSLTRPDAHEPIIARADFDAVGRLDVTAVKPGPVNHYLLAGSIRCASCGGRLGGAWNKNVNHKDGGRFVYRCRRRWSWGDCPRPVSIEVGVLDAYIIAQVFKMAAEAPDSDLVSEDYDEAVRERDEAEMNLNYFLTSPAILDLRKRLGNAAADEAVTAYVDVLDAAEQRLQALRMTTMAPGISTTLQNDWTNLPIETQRAIVCNLLPVIAVKPGRGDVENRVRMWATNDPDIPTELPGRRFKGMKPLV